MDLKEKIKKKNARIRELNKKIELLEWELKHTNEYRRYYLDLFNSIQQLLPMKIYKITYEYFENGVVKRKIESIEACHYQEAKIEIKHKLNIHSHEINFIEIQQMAS